MFHTYAQSLPGVSHTRKREGLYTLNTDTTEKQDARFEKCIGCPDMGVRCSGPNLALLPIAELRTWVRKWKEHFALSVEACGEIWGIGGSARRFLGGQETGFQYATVQSIVQGVVSYGLPPETVASTEPCPSTSAEINARVCEYERELKTSQEEYRDLLERKNNSAKESVERLVEQRDGYEKRLDEKQNTIDFLKELAEKRRVDAEEQKAVSADYLARIDAKNEQLMKLYEEIRNLHAENLRLSAGYAAESNALVDRILHMTELHAEEIKAITSK